MAASFRGLFQRQARRPTQAQRARRGAARTGFESLESRAMLAITGLPSATGDQLGMPIILSSNGAGPNGLDITLENKIIGSTPFVVATINGTTNQYWNFGNSISFTGDFDTTGTIANDATITTPYGVNLVQGATATQWNSTADFTPVGLADVKVNLTWADSLKITTPFGAAVGSGPSSIVGTFTSPTLAPGPGAEITIESNAKVSVLAAGVNTYGLTLTGTRNGAVSSIDLQGPVNATNVTFADTNSITVDQSINAQNTISITSSKGSVDVNKSLTAGGDITVTAEQSLTTNAVITSVTGAVTLTATTGALIVNDDITASAAVTLLGNTGVTTNAVADVTSQTAAVTVTSAAGFVKAAGSLTATGGAVTVTAALAADTAVVTANKGVTLTSTTGSATTSAATLVTGDGAVNVTGNVDVAIAGAVTILGTGGVTYTATTGDVLLTAPTTTNNGGITITANSDIEFAAATTILATGNLQATATAGDIAVLPAAPIVVTSGTIDLQAVAGRVDVEARVLAGLAITVQAAQGIALSNAVDAAAEIRATGPAGSVTLTNAANQILVDAPVTSQADAVTITSSLDDVVVRDDVSALLDLKISANTTVTANGLAAPITLTSKTGTIDVTSTKAGLVLGPNLVVVAGPGAAAGVNFTAATTVSLAVPVAAQGNIAITSPDGFTVQQPLASALGTVTITSPNGPITSVLAPITASGAITIDANDAVTLDNTLTSTLAGISITSKSSTVSLAATASLVATSVPAGAIAIAAAGAFSMGNHLTAGGDLTVTTGASFTPVKNFTSTNGNVTITVDPGDLDVTGSTVSAAGGSVTLAAPNGQIDVDLSTVVVNSVSGSLTVTAGNALTIVPSGAFTAGLNISLSSLSGFTPPVGGDLKANFGDITLTFGGTIDVSNVNVDAPNGSISLTSKNGNVTVGTKSFTVEPATVGAITLSALSGTVAVGQSLLAGSDVTIEALNTYTSSHAITTATGNVSITSNNGDVIVTAPITCTTIGGVTLVSNAVNGKVDVSSAGAVIAAPLGGITYLAPAGTVILNSVYPLLAAGGVTVSCLDTLVVPAPITVAAGGISLTSTAGFIEIGADLSAPTGLLLMVAGKEINDGTVNGAVTTVVQADTLTAVANGIGMPPPMFIFTNPLNDVTFLQVDLSNGAVAPVGARIEYVDANDFTVNGAVSATGPVRFTSVGAGIAVIPTIGAAPSALSEITLTAVAAISVTGSLTLNAAGDITITSSANAITVGGTITTVAGDIVLTSGGGVGVTVGGVITAVGGTAPSGRVTIDSVGAIAIGAAPAAITATDAVTLTSATGGITIAGTVAGGANVDLVAPTGAIAVTGSVTAGVAHDLTATGGLAVAITGPVIFAGSDVIVNAGTAITLGTAGAAIAANTGSVLVASTGAGGVGVTGAITALSGGITIDTPDTITFTGAALTAAATYVAPGPVGLIRLAGSTCAVVGTAPVVIAGRFEVTAVTTSPIAFTGANQVKSLYVNAAGSFTFNNYADLEITDFLPAIPTVQVTTGSDLTIRNFASGVGGGRFRVVDGISCGGVLSLEANQSAAGVEFVTTTAGDNLGIPAFFFGTLRDMIGYINANVATFGTVNATMSAVFDEPASPVALTGTVVLQDTLPVISKRITFNGLLPATKAGVSIGGIVGISGNSKAVNGLTLAAGSAGSTVQNAALHDFTGTGIEVDSSSNVLRGLYVGYDRAMNPAGNGVGIDVVGAGAVQNVVGINVAGDPGNMIANNREAGLRIRGGANYTRVQGNQVLNNGSHGISISRSLGTLVGGDSTVLTNVITGNGGSGVLVFEVAGTSLAYGAQIVGNTISGSGAAGVTIRGGRRNLVGGTGLSAGNTITGNTDGVVLVSSITSATSGNLVAGNTVSANTIDGIRIVAGYDNRINGNTVADNDLAGVRIVNATSSDPGCGCQLATNRVVNNVITGNGSLPTNGGIVLQSSNGQVIGIAVGGKAAGNSVTDNLGSGIVVLGATGVLQSQSNTVAFNETSRNTFDGIRVEGATGNAIRSNVARSNVGAGIAILDANAGKTVGGNRVTTNEASRNGTGIRVAGGSGNTIGGTLPALGNRVFGSLGDGILVESSPNTGPAVGTLVRNNQIGLDGNNLASPNAGFGVLVQDSRGTLVDYANRVRNNLSGGVKVTGGDNNTIGAPQPGRGNDISANGGDGIWVAEPAVGPARTQVVVIAGNAIESNTGIGVHVTGARTSGVRIGREPSITQPNGTSNGIRSNGLGGVVVDAAQAVTIIGNTIIGNGGTLPIDLVNGANGGVAAPRITQASARVSGQRTPQYDVRGTVTGQRGQRFYVDLYGNRATDGVQFYLGRVIVTVGPTGIGSFRTIVNGGLGGVTEIVGTATLANTLYAGTSEFSS